MLDLMINKMLERMKYNLGTRKDLNSKNHNERQLAATTIDRTSAEGSSQGQETLPGVKQDQWTQWDPAIMGQHQLSGKQANFWLENNLRKALSIKTVSMKCIWKCNLKITPQPNVKKSVLITANKAIFKFSLNAGTSCCLA